MTEQRTRVFEPEDLVFFGAVTASISHELKNVSTIINESAGLLHDLSLGAEAGRRALDPSRIKKMSEDIARNIERSVGILNRMNRFAHSVDEPLRDVDMRSVLLDTVELARRFCSVHGVELQTSAPSEAVPVTTYVFGMHRALFTAIQAIVLDVQGVRPAEVNLVPEGALALVRLRRGDWVPCEGTAARRVSLERLVSALGGAVSWDDGAGRPELVLRVPAA